MRVKELSDRLGVPTDTIRYYTRIGLLKPVRLGNGYKSYGKREMQVLKFCMCAKQLGFSLADIERIVNMSEHGETPCPTVRDILDQNLNEVKEKLADCQLLLARMEDAQNTWSSIPDQVPTGESICQLIEKWDSETFSVSREKVLAQ
jgi:DNA-binding transcriptional MerR regulator